MIFETKIPEPPLDQYVQNIVYYSGYSPVHAMERFFPDGTTNLVIDLDDFPKYIYDNITLKEKQECNQSWFSGMQTEYLTISSGADSEMMVITFKPGASFPFIHTSLEPLRNKVVPAKQVLGNSVLGFRAELKTCASPDDKISRAESWLLSQLGDVSFSGEVIQHFVTQIKEVPAAINLKEISKKSGYSQKQFIHLFKKYVGLTPKQFHRIVRFNEILGVIHKKERINWADVHTKCGYYDQAHFIKDFQAFSGLNPEKYLEDQGEWPHYMPVK
ncbi:MAG TPA: AraC family transcriptional regulator [Eudoraea sp.]|nr:AraC family transcriptional regulator [Eudoraea sp.]